MAQRSNYWSCSKFADWVRGKPKLSAGTSDQWHEWENEAKRYHPVRYWIAEEARQNIRHHSGQQVGSVGVHGVVHKQVLIIWIGQ